MERNIQSPALLRRKVLKPLMEKRRRARINHCLSELKRFLVASDYSFLEKHQSSRSQRIEKADILEMTVKYLREHKASEQDPTERPEFFQRFQEGYRQCVVEVSRYAVSTMGLNVRDTLLGHLQKCLSSLTSEKDCVRMPCPPSPPESSFCGQAGFRSGTSLDFGYETGSPTDASDDSSDSGDAHSPSGECVSQHHVPEDYSIPKEQRNGHVPLSDVMWRPW